MLLSPAPQTFTTFNTFTTFAIFAKFANFNSALEHPTLRHCHASRLRSISEHSLDFTSPSPCADGRGTPRSGWRLRG